MAAPSVKSKHRARELRRRVVARARVRAGAQWGDACILNISSRGLLILTARPIFEGSTVEVLKGDHLMIARVVWTSAGRSGLRSNELLPVEEILSLDQGRSLQLIASNGVLHDRRRGLRRAPVDSRTRGRLLEFLAVGAIAASLAAGTWVMAQHALTKPLARAEAALGG
jgi:hypothetical protein